MDKYTRLISGFIFLSAFLPSVMSQKVPGQMKTPQEIRNEERFITALYKDIAGKRDEAITILDTIRREAPHAAVYLQLARWYMEKNDFMTTEKYVESALELDPSNIWIHEFAAELYDKTGQYDKSVKAYDQLISFKPEKSTYYTKLVNTHIKRGDYTAALQTLDRQQTQMGLRESIVMRKAEIYDNIDQTDKAIELLDEFSRGRYDEKDFLRIIVNILKSHDRTPETEPYLKRILSLDPGDKETQLDVFLLNRSTPDKDNFLLSLRPLISNKHVPLDVKIQELLPFVRQHASSGDSALGAHLISLMDELVIVHPDEAKAHAINGDILKNAEKYTSAIRQYEKTLTFSRKHSVVWEQYMFCLDAVSDYATLSWVADEAIDYFPNEALFYFFAGKARFKNGSKDAGMYLDDALLIGSGNTYVESMVWATKGDMALSVNQIEKALEWARKSFDISQGQNPVSSELLGDIARAQNNPTQALEHYTQALKYGGVKIRIQTKINAL